MTRKTNLSNMRLTIRWENWTNSGEYWRWRGDDKRHEIWLDKIRKDLIDPTEADQIMFCTECNTPMLSANALPHPNNDGTPCCSPCDQLYRTCACGERERYLTETLENAEDVCDRCLRLDYTHCDDCQGFYLDENVHEHRHECCESPAQSFTIPNDDNSGLLANDTRTTIMLPAGLISEEGLAEIRSYLSNENYAHQQNHQQDLDNLSVDEAQVRYEGYRKYQLLIYRLHEIGVEWQTKDGNYTKRLSRFFYKEAKLKITPEQMSKIGSIASDHSKAIDFEIETTRNLNLSAADFAHEDSCWWSSYSESRCSLKTNGGFGLRTFDTFDRVSGRAWVMPMKTHSQANTSSTSNATSNALMPTFNCDNPVAYVVFNGYGTLAGYNSARILAHMTGLTYRKIEFSCKEMYVNSDTGYLVSGEEVAQHNKKLHISPAIHSNLFRSEREFAHVA